MGRIEGVGLLGAGEFGGSSRYWWVFRVGVAGREGGGLVGLSQWVVQLGRVSPRPMLQTYSGTGEIGYRYRD